MTFENLNTDTECSCLDNCLDLNETLYGLKTNKSSLRDVDFNSKWEKGDKTETGDCETVCSKKGLSLSVLSDLDIKEKVISIYKQLFPVSPTYKPFLSVIRFKEKSGKIKPTPLDGNPYHHDFYKCDSFSLSNVSLIETISLAEVV
jgi:hypothetical protein